MTNEQCPKCQSDNIMERRGMLHDYCGFVCLNCGEQWDQYGQDTK